MSLHFFMHELMPSFINRYKLLLFISIIIFVFFFTLIGWLFCYQIFHIVNVIDLRYLSNPLAFSKMAIAKLQHSVKLKKKV